MISALFAVLQKNNIYNASLKAASSNRKGGERGIVGILELQKSHLTYISALDSVFTMF